MTAALPAYTTEANTSADLLALERSLCDPHGLSYVGGRPVLPQGAQWRRIHGEEWAAIARNHMFLLTGAPCLVTGAQMDILTQERCRCCVCGLRSIWDRLSTAANPK